MEREGRAAPGLCRAIVPIVLSAALVAQAADGGVAESRAQTLVTPGFRVTVEVRCAEGNVSCDDVRYVGTSRKSGKSIRLAGKTSHAPCADGVTPCRFLGYVFRNGRVVYFVSDDGRLRVTEGEKVLVDERGEWQ